MCSVIVAAYFCQFEASKIVEGERERLGSFNLVDNYCNTRFEALDLKHIHFLQILLSRILERSIGSFAYFRVWNRI